MTFLLAVSKRFWTDHRATTGRRAHNLAHAVDLTVFPLVWVSKLPIYVVVFSCASPVRPRYIDGKKLDDWAQSGLRIIRTESAPVPASPNFIHLRTHSAFSLLEGAIQVKDMVKIAKNDQMPALAITDSGNLFGELELSEVAAGAGVQPIIGRVGSSDADGEDA